MDILHLFLESKELFPLKSYRLFSTSLFQEVKKGFEIVKIVSSELEVIRIDQILKIYAFLIVSN